MRKITFRLFFALITVTGLLTSPALADLGLKQIAAEQGAPAVGQAVLAAVQAVYANNTDPAIIQSQLVAILNEVAATANENAVRYAIVAVMMGGGVENRELSKSAINASDVSSNYEAMTVATVTETETLLTEKPKDEGPKQPDGGAFLPPKDPGDGDLPATRP
jgi:hypothetical protein